MRHSLLPLSLSICSSNFSKRARQRNWTRQLSNPPAMSEDGRWSSPFFFFLFSPVLLLSRFKNSHSRLPLEVFFMLFCPNKERRGGSRLSSQVGERLAQAITPEQDDHEGAADPYCAPSGIYIPCLCVITPRIAALSFTINLCRSCFQRKAVHEGKKHCVLFCFVFLCLLKVTVYFCLSWTHLKLQRTLGNVSEEKEGKRKQKNPST